MTAILLRLYFKGVSVVCSGLRTDYDSRCVRTIEASVFVSALVAILRAIFYSLLRCCTYETTAICIFNYVCNVVALGLICKFVSGFASCTFIFVLIDLLCWTCDSPLFAMSYSVYLSVGSGECFATTS